MPSGAIVTTARWAGRPLARSQHRCSATPIGVRRPWPTCLTDCSGLHGVVGPKPGHATYPFTSGRRSGRSSSLRPDMFLSGSTCSSLRAEAATLPKQQPARQRPLLAATPPPQGAAWGRSSGHRPVIPTPPAPPNTGQRGRRRGQRAVYTAGSFQAGGEARVWRCRKVSDCALFFGVACLMKTARET